MYYVCVIRVRVRVDSRVLDDDKVRVDVGIEGRLG